MVDIRTATIRDIGSIRQVHLGAFPEEERETIAVFAVELLDENTNPGTISLVADAGSEVVGHVAFSPVTIGMDKNWGGYILAPLAVKPGHQGRRVGTRLIEAGIERLAKMRANVLLVYGDPDYYGRFGFDAASATLYTPPFELQYPFGWQALVIESFSLPGAPVKLFCVESLNNPELW